MPVPIQHLVSRARQLLLAKNFSSALREYEKLVKKYPDEAVLWFEYGNAASGLRQTAVADNAWNRAMDLAPWNAELIGLIGHQYQAMRKSDLARACFSRAAAADPKGINPRISLAVLAEQNHQLDEARAAVEACLAIDSRDDQARYFQALLERRQNKLELAERLLRELIDSEPRHPYVRYASRYELANVLDRIGCYDEAMSWLLDAKQIVRGLTDTNLLLARYDQNTEAARRFTAGLPSTILQTWAGYFPEQRREAIPTLAFLGGHPRSGTTLLEQVLDAHPSIAAFDESTAFLNLLQPEFQKSKDLSSTRLNTLRRLYVQTLSSERGSEAEGKVLVDKNPSATARLPIWLRVFPELRVLIALRDPRDVVLSCFFQNIPLNADNVNFLSLERTAKHYVDLMGLWLTAKKWEGFAWLETRYEGMVQNPQEEGRRTTEFLGLAWHERQTIFYDQSLRKQLYSPTYQDVTLPIYRRSLGRWHFYEKYLAPIFPTLEPCLREFGYQ